MFIVFQMTGAFQDVVSMTCGSSGELAKIKLGRSPTDVYQNLNEVPFGEEEMHGRIGAKKESQRAVGKMLI